MRRRFSSLFRRSPPPVRVPQATRTGIEMTTCTARPSPRRSLNEGAHKQSG